MSNVLLGLTDAQLMARGRYTSLRSAQRKLQQEAQKRVVTLHDQGRMILRFVEPCDQANLEATFTAMASQTEALGVCITEAAELQVQLDELRPQAWGPTKEME